MSDERSYPGVYLDEDPPPSAVDGVDTESASDLRRLVRFAAIAGAIIGYRALRRRRRRRI